ncbi:MAG TPA: stage III sporulation protein AA, partial [Clostridia bacterium]|nr:stage III sporulation protein AA [Clostridia bacterium]
TLELITSNSVYAFQEEIRNGYITIKGGHRVGIAGKIVSEGLYVKSIKDIMSLNIRVSKEVKGCADKIFQYLIKGENDLYNTLIVSPPQCGKTTMLRDLTRLLSTGCKVNGFRGIKVCVVDERSEIAACYKGVPQNDVGVRTDILDSCPKIAGMIMGLRALSPVVIVTDEIGNEGDKDAITRVLNAGVKILTTAHGYSISELKARKEVMELIEEKVFERYVVLSSREGPGTVEEIIEGENFKNIYKGEFKNIYEGEK